MARKHMENVEWPTLAVLAVTYAIWVSGTTWIAEYSLLAAILVTGIATAQFSSLQHEALHGHPFHDPRLNAAIVFPGLTLVYPYLRFRDTHLAHHLDSRLTDPYDDPESNYLDPGVWDTLPRWWQRVLLFNNTLLGRLLVGPAIGTLFFLRGEFRDFRHDPKVLRGWLWHVPAVAMVFAWLSWAAMPVWAYFISAYIGLALIRVRTFLEHQAHDRASGRTVIIEDRGPLAFLFLNNNLHVVHHMHPRVPWYRLPELYAKHREKYLRANEGYRYKSYGEIFRRYFLHRKDPVPHPLWRRG